MRKKSNASLVPRRGKASWKGLACLVLAGALAACGPGTARDARRPARAPSQAQNPPASAVRRPSQAPEPAKIADPAGQAPATGGTGGQSLPAAEPQAPAPAPPASPSPAEKAKPAIPPSIAQPRAFSLASVAGPVFPEDFAIGPLQDLRPARLDEKAAAEAATAFLGGLLEGKLAAAVVLPERLALLEAFLAPLLSGERPVSYRLGAIDFSEGPGARDGASAVAGVALFGAAGAAGRRAAEIALRRTGSAWYVESFQAAAPGGDGKAGAAGVAYEPRLRRP